MYTIYGRYIINKKIEYFDNIFTLNLINKIKIMKNNKHYRYGDVIFNKGFYWKDSIDFILENMPDSILGKYLQNKRNIYERESNDIICEKFNNVIKEHIKKNYIILPKDNELVIHLRVGDVVVKDWFLEKNYQYIIKNYINKYGINKCTFCTAFHYGNYIERNLWIYSDESHEKNKTKLYNLFKELTEQFKISFDVKSSPNIDDDFIYMLKAKHFVSDKGGFSTLIKNIRTYNGLSNDLYFNNYGETSNVASSGALS
tara:strand:+ start:5345 stop:6115 length:771 start_codon:yes stop_codon:yes gene_type:complete